MATWRRRPGPGPSSTPTVDPIHQLGLRSPAPRSRTARIDGPSRVQRRQHDDRVVLVDHAARAARHPHLGHPRAARPRRSSSGSRPGTTPAAGTPASPTRPRSRYEEPSHHRRPGGMITTPNVSGEPGQAPFGELVRAAGLLGSMGRVASSVDNAMIESFFSTLQRELLDTRSLGITPRGARLRQSSSGSRPGTTRAAGTPPSTTWPQPTTSSSSHPVNALPSNRRASGVITTSPVKVSAARSSRGMLGSSGKKICEFSHRREAVRDDVPS